MTIVTTDDHVISCCTDDCRKSFTSVHGWRVHYGQTHEKKKTTCATCNEEFADRHAGQMSQCIDCLREHGPLKRGVTAD